MGCAKGSTGGGQQQYFRMLIAGLSAHGNMVPLIKIKSVLQIQYDYNLVSSTTSSSIELVLVYCYSWNKYNNHLLH